MVSSDCKKILLIEPPFYRLYKDTYSLDMLPLSLGYLGASIKKNSDWDVILYNADFSVEKESVALKYLVGEGFVNYQNSLNSIDRKIWQEIREVIARCKPSVVGISAKTQNFKSASVVAKIVKDISDKIIVVMGGPHPSMVGSDVMKCREVDICVFGEAEVTIVELLGAFEGKNKIENISGIIYRENDSVVRSQNREMIRDLDALDFPFKYAAEILYDFPNYPKNAFAHIFATRGCPYNCTFCGSRYIWTRRVRFRSPENVVQELRMLQKEGINFVRFEDDTFGINNKYLQVLCDAIRQNCPGLAWSCEIPVQLVDEKNISLMKKAGCYQISIGVESGSNEILSVINKNITIEKAFQACSLIKKHRIALAVFFMVGFPQETEKSLADTIMAIKKIKCDYVVYSIFTPYPGTETYALCKDLGLISDDHDYSMFNHQSPENNFCVNISHERFREIVSNLEGVIEKRNSAKLFKSILSVYSLTRIRQLGFKKSIKIAVHHFSSIIGNDK
jgi:anaerobic magnesium-protoporphyrin IX monomethyl ester cyclase